MATVYTIGHSTRPIDEFVEALRAHRIRTVVDIRAFPVSRRLPQFNRESLEKTLPASGVRYVWMKSLGGYRKKILSESPHLALRNGSFRNYADYMLTSEFEQAMTELIGLRMRLARPICARSGSIFDVIACWYPTGWSPRAVKCCTSTARVRSNPISSPPRRT